MSEFKIDGPGFYRQRNGSKAEIVGKNAFGLWAGFDYGEGESAYANCESWDSLGRYRHDMDEPDESGLDLVARWPRFAVGDKVLVVDAYGRVRRAMVTREPNNSNNRYMVEDGGWSAWMDESELATDDRPTPQAGFRLPKSDDPEQWTPTCELRWRPTIGLTQELVQKWTCGDKSEWRPIPGEVTE